MFMYCSSLTEAPYLPAEKITSYSYYNMFYGCSNLEFVDAAFTEFNPTNATTNWLSGVKAAGTFNCPVALGTDATITRGTSYCPTGWTVTNTNYLRFVAKTAGATISMSAVGMNAPAIYLKTSIDYGKTWQPFYVGSTIITLANIGDCVYFAADGSNARIGAGTASYNNFVMTGSIDAYGSVMSLLDGSGTGTEITDTYCFSHLFDGCDGLGSAPKLPATTLKLYCYYSMFKGCTSLVAAPELPAMTAPRACYAYMFAECSSLVTAPAMPATSIALGCYMYMFQNCTSLANAPVLPALTVASNCYRSMFNGCTSLTTPPPSLPANSITGDNVYESMFYGCSNLETAPAIGLTVVPTSSNAMAYMFKDCSKLKSVTVFFKEWPNAEILVDWLDGVSASGEFICPSALGTEGTIARGTSRCPSGWTVKNHDYLTFTAETAGATITISKVGSAPSVSLKTSIDDGATWQPFYVGTTTITLSNMGDSVYFAADGSNKRMASSTSAYNKFEMTGSISAGGSIMSLLDGSGVADTMPTTYGFCYLFFNCTGLTTAPRLPATTLAGYCYDYMFRGCTSLSSAPSLPASTLAVSCYYGMFWGCSSLVTAPTLSATTLASGCYYGMFRECTSLTTAPPLFATTTVASCYRYMFYGCTALATPPPTLPATALTGTYTYQYMFYGCSNLEKAPVIGLTTTPSSTQQMRYMFQNCSKLKEIEIHITSWPTTATIMGDWVNGVAATGTFKCPTALGTDATITRGTGNCPTGWTVVNI